MKENKPGFYHLKEMLRPYPNSISGKRWAVFEGKQFTVVFYEFTPAEYVMKPESEWTFAEPKPLHSHESEQLAFQFEGSQGFHVDENVDMMGPYVMSLVPSGSVHGGGDWPMEVENSNGVFLSCDIFSPPRHNYYEAYLNSPEE